MQNTILALDVGTRHLGVALFNKSQQEAYTLESFTFRDFYQLSAHIKKLIESYTVETIVIGDMGTSLTNPTIQRLQHDLQHEGVKVQVVGERYTTAQAKNEQEPHEKDDHSRAAIQILREYMAAQKNLV